MELTSIYRTYRPQRWEDVVGQDLIVKTLTNEIAHETLVHAYLFTGTRGVGKTTTARLLAKSINCEKRKKGDVEPCNTCPACVAINEGRSLDIMEIDAASHTGVDNVRENIIAASRVAPLDRKMKVFIIDEVHMLSTAAFNALLKTLEEPSSNVVFILATTDSDRVPDTIISRCQRFDFRRVSATDIERRLTQLAASEGVHVVPEVIALLVRYADGSLRDAESMLGQLIGLGEKKITKEEAALVLPRGDEDRAKEFLTLLRQGNGGGALTIVDDFVARGGDVGLFVEDCIRITRLVLVDTLHHEKGVATENREELVVLLRRLLDAAREVALVHPPVLVLELLVAAYTLSATSVSERVLPEKTLNPKKQTKESREVPLLSLTVIQDRWKDVLAVAKKYNHSLALILKVATPMSIGEETLTLGFRYAFHADRLEDHTTKRVACRIFEEVFARPLDLRTTVVQTHTENPSSFLDDIITTFGGKVVKKSSEGVS